MKRTIDLTNMMKMVETNLMPILQSITTDGFNDKVQANFLEQVEGYLNQASSEELESLLADGVAEEIVDSLGED